MTQKRKRLSGPEKVAIVKRYLINRAVISDLSEGYELQPSQIYRWQAALFEHGADVFDLKKGRRAKAAESAQVAQIVRLEAVVAQKEAKIAQKNEVISELMEDTVLKKKPVGPLKGRWVPPDTRAEVVDYVGKWTQRAELPAKRLLAWIGLSTSKYHLWREHYGRPHAHNTRDGWLEAWEKQAIVDFHRRFPLEGYRRLTYMMLDQDVVAVSPTIVYRVLKGASLLDRKK